MGPDPARGTMPPSEPGHAMPTIALDSAAVHLHVRHRNRHWPGHHRGGPGPFKQRWPLLPGAPSGGTCSWAIAR